MIVLLLRQHYLSTIAGMQARGRGYSQNSLCGVVRVSPDVDCGWCGAAVT